MLLSCHSTIWFVVVVAAAVVAVVVFNRFLNKDGSRVLFGSVLVMTVKGISKPGAGHECFGSGAGSVLAARPIWLTQGTLRSGQPTRPTQPTQSSQLSLFRYAP